jgi:hypothetical protein
MLTKRTLFILAFGLIVAFIVTSTVLSQEAPIHIVKAESSVSPNPASINQSVVVKICLYNLNESEVPCVLKFSAVNDLSIYPSGEQNVTVLGKGHGYISPSYARTYFYFTVISNRTGSYPITVELWYGAKQVDFYSAALQIQEEQQFDILSYDFRLSFVYWMALFSVGIVYLKVLYDEEKLGDWSGFWKLGLSYLLCLLIVVEINYFWGGFSTILRLLISPSIGRIELVLAITLILSFASLILMKNRLDVSFKLANVIVFLIILPIVLDWLLLPSIPPSYTLAGEIIWQLIEIVVSTFIGYILSIIFKPKMDKAL